MSNQIEWRDSPGCFERHLQRRYRNPLFPAEKREISSEELKKARIKDDHDQWEFAKKYGILFSEANRLNEISPINDLMLCLQDTQNLLESAFSIGGHLEKEIGLLEILENNMIEILNSKLPQGADMLKQAHSLSAMNRIPYLAESKRSDTPILKGDELPSLLSEDIETIRCIGFLSRSFPDFKPDSNDVRVCLNNAIRNGLDTEYAKEVIEAWNKA